MKTNSKAIIFVTSQQTARYLKEILAKSYQALSPRYVVGQAGIFGMAWDGPGGQREVLEDFRSGANVMKLFSAVNYESS
jgi:ERCC4-related helicase